MNYLNPIKKKPKLYGKNSFSDYRKRQEEKHHKKNKNNSLFDSVLTIEINLTELCNRKCSFCPRINPKIYPNRNLMMDLKLCEKISNDLKILNYKGRISFSGFGEPLLNKKFIEYIRILKKEVPSSFLETNTNGDKLTVDVINNLYESGLDKIYINLYDNADQIDHFENLFKKTKVNQNFWKLRPHWLGSEKDFGLILNNRSGMLVNPNEDYLPIKDVINSPCYYPFYKLFIDWNGDILGCSNDWGRTMIFGNITREFLGDIWLNEKFTKLRKRLYNGNRNHTPCNKCNINGKITGKKSADILKPTLS